MDPWLGLGPPCQMGPGVEPSLPPRLRRRAHRRPALPLHPVGERPADVLVHRRVVRHHRHRSPVHGRHHAHVEHLAAAQVGPRRREAFRRGGGRWRPEGAARCRGARLLQI